MKYSLLYKTAEKYKYGEGCAQELTYDLSVDKIAEALCGNKQKAEYFLNVIRRPLTDAADIEFRREILSDFRKTPELLGELRALLNRYDGILSDWRAMRPSASVSGVQSGDPAMTEYAFSSLRVAATFSKTVVTYIRFIKEALDRAEPGSEGLRSIAERCTEMLSSGALDTVNSVAELISDPSYEKYDFELAVELDGAMRLGKSELSSLRIAEKKKKKILSKILSAKKDPKGALSLPYDLEEKNLMLNRGLMSLYSDLNGIATELYGLFFGLSKELIFYECAVKYEQFLENRGIERVFAEVLPREADTVDMRGLKDLYLLLGADDRKEIVPWDITLKKNDRGMLIKGENSSGKTSFLRAVGTAQLFTQAGLPICASSAKLSIRGAIFTQFSSAEKDFSEEDRAGRFEGEVKQIAAIVDGAVPYTLALLNETFQTTAYGEGTEGIYNVLEYFADTGTKFLFVTHLTGLFDMLRGSGTVFAETKDRFRIEITE